MSAARGIQRGPRDAARPGTGRPGAFHAAGGRAAAGLRRTLHRRAAAGGFTLIEIVVALLITAIIGVLSYRGLSGLLRADERLRESASAWLELHRFVALFEADLRNAVPRPGRDAGGAVQAPLIGLPVAERPFGAQLALQRATQAVDGATAGVQRVAWRFADGEVRQLLWPAPDLAPYGEPAELLLLSGVARFTIRYQAAGSPVWADRWPPPGASANALPRGLELTLEMSDGSLGGPLTWVFAL